MSFKPTETVNRNAMHKFTNLLLSATLVVSSVLSMAAAPQMRKVSATNHSSSAAIAQKASAVPMKAQAKQVKFTTTNLAERKQKKSSFVEKAGKISTIRQKGKAVRLAAASDAAPDNLQGLVIYSDSWLEEDINWSIVPTSASEDFVEIFPTPDVYSAYMAFYKDGIVYEHDFYEFWGMILALGINAYDAESGELIDYYEGEDLSIIGIGAAEDPTSGIVYGFMYNAEGSALTLSTLDYNDETGCTVTEIADVNEAYAPNVIVCGNDGQLYAVCKDGCLYKVNKSTAEFTLVGDTGLYPNYLASATVDRKSGKMYYAISDAFEAGFLAEVDLATGEASTVYEFPYNDEIVGLCIPLVANDGAPAAVNDFEVEFVDGSLSGTYSFTAPTTLYDGTAATGSVSYKVLANGETVASGTTTYGATVSGDLEMKKSGKYTFTAVCSNAEGDGPKTTVKQFVGSGTVAAPEDVKAVADGQNVTVSWSAVTESIDGGYINPAEVLYNVVRYNGGESLIIANRVPETSVTDVIPVPDGLQAYYYEVTAEFDNIKSSATVSNTLVFGSAALPYSHDFAEENNLDGFTILNNNNDDREWELTDNAVVIKWHSSNDMDDYLVFPPMNLEAGSLYEVTVTLASQSSFYTEAIEIVYGTELSAAGLDQIALDRYEFSNGSYEDVSAYVIPQTSDRYFIAIHGVSDADMYQINVAAVAVSGAKSALTPAAVEDLTVEAVAAFQTEAKISFKAPSKNMKGDAISTIDKIEIFRGKTSVKTFTNVAAGEAVTYTDNAGADGTYDYSVVPSNAEGEGPAVSASVYVGATKPGNVAKPTIVETQVGSVKVTWEPVTEDIYGAPLPEGVVTYSVIDSDGFAVAEGLTVTSFETQVCEAGEQAFTQFAVVAVTSAGNGGGEYSDMIAVGTPYTEYDESFADGELHYIMGIVDIYGQPEWSICPDDYFADITSADNDGGFIGMYANYLDFESALLTGLISIPAEGNPAFFFNTYNIVDSEGTPDLNIVTIMVQEKGATEPVEIYSEIVSELAGDTEGWVQGVVSLEAYKGKDVQIYICGKIKAYTWVLFDMFRVGQIVDNDLAVASVKAPAQVLPGEDYVVNVTVANNGAKDATAFNVELYVDDELVETEPYESLASGKKVTATFGLTASAVAVDPIAVQAKVVYTADEYADNNESRVVEIIPVLNDFPYVTDLKATANDGSVALTWTAPDASGYTISGEEGFEDGYAGEGVEGTYAGWTLIDGDGSEVGGINGYDIPGINPGSTTAAFFIFDSSDLSDTPDFAAHSGDKFLAAMFRYDDGTTDDWAISPKLNGEAQTISLWAKSFNTSYPEKIGFYYSSTGLNTDDFVVVTEPFVVNTKEWTNYTFDVPAGAKYFAIRSCATGSFMLMIDDVTFKPAQLALEGYDIYRDAVKINDSLVKETSYTDVNGGGAYNVVTIYSLGASRASNTATADESGLSDLAAGLKISAVDGNIIVRGAAGKAITVNTVDGKTIFATASADAQVKVPVSQGIYLVKAGQTVAKVIVK